MDKTTIPVFYACDDNFAKYAAVSIYSLKKNASRLNTYNVHVLHTGLSEEARKTLLSLADANFNIVFDDVNEYLSTVSEKLPVRDYYSVTTYYRFFIAEMHPEYDKAIYVDSDTVVQGDISELYRTDLGGNLLAACADRVVTENDTFGEYCERVLGIPRGEYLQACVWTAKLLGADVRDISYAPTELGSAEDFATMRHAAMEAVRLGVKAREGMRGSDPIGGLRVVE